jgi:hypothetical protein
MILDKKTGIFGGVGKRVFPGNPVSGNIWIAHRIPHRIIFGVSGSDIRANALRAGAVVR